MAFHMIIQIRVDVIPYDYVSETLSDTRSSLSSVPVPKILQVF